MAKNSSSGYSNSSSEFVTAFSPSQRNPDDECNLDDADSVDDIQGIDDDDLVNSGVDSDEESADDRSLSSAAAATNNPEKLTVSHGQLFSGPARSSSSSKVPNDTEVISPGARNRSKSLMLGSPTADQGPDLPLGMRWRPPSIHIDNASMNDNTHRPASPSLSEMTKSATNNHDGASLVSAATGDTADSGKKKQTYFHKFAGFGLKSSAKTQTPAITSQNQSGGGFKLTKRIPAGGFKRGTGAVGDDETDDVSTSGTSGFRGTKSRVTANAGYIAVKTKNKQYADLARLKKVQQISANGFTAATKPISKENDNYPVAVQGAILAMKFNGKGKFLATGGADGILRIWIVSKGARDSENPMDKINALKVNTLSVSSGGTDSTVKHVRSISNLTGPDRFFKFADSSTTTQSSPVALFSSTALTQVLSPSAHCTFRGHSAPILDISWSKSNFIVSASADKTVRLWHLTANICLKVFLHHAPVTAVRFHPSDDHYFASGAGTVNFARLRVWNIPEKRVKHWVVIKTNSAGVTADSAASLPSPATPTNSVSLPNSFITAIEFSKDGSLIVTGTSEGSLYFHEFNGLKYNTRVDLTPLSNPKLFKITGIESLTTPFGTNQNIDMSKSDVTSFDSANAINAAALSAGYILVTATDSRVRLFNLRDKSLVRRYRGPDIRTIGCMKAVGSEDGQFAICGSEDSRVYVWNLDPNSSTIVQPTTLKSGRNSEVAAHGQEEDISPKSGGDTNVVTVGGKSGGFGGVFSGLMNWDQSRYGQYERFIGSSNSITCALFAPASVRAILSSDQNAGFLPNTANLSGAVILVADVVGNIHIFENELLQIDTVAKPLSKLKTDNKPLKAPTEEKRAFSAPVTVAPIKEQSLKGPNDDIHPVSPTIDELQHVRKNNSYELIPLLDVFGTTSKEIFFLPKRSTKAEAPPPDSSSMDNVPALSVSNSTENLSLDILSRRRRSHSTGPLLEKPGDKTRTGIDSDITLIPSAPGLVAPTHLLHSTSTIGKSSFLDSLRLRTHAKTVSKTPNQTPVIDSGSSSTGTTSTHHTLIGGLITRLRGHTVIDSHTRSSSNPTQPSAIQKLDLKNLPVPKLSETARRHGFIKSNTDVSIEAPKIIHGLTEGLSRLHSGSENIHLEDEELITCQCGCSKFYFSIQKRLICIECHTKIDAI